MQSETDISKSPTHTICLEKLDQTAERNQKYNETLRRAGEELKNSCAPSAEVKSCLHPAFKGYHILTSRRGYAARSVSL